MRIATLLTLSVVGAVVAVSAQPGQAALIARYSFDNGDFLGTGTAGSPYIANDSAAPAANATATGTNGGSSITPGLPGVFGNAFGFVRDSAPTTAVNLADYENLLNVPTGVAPSGNAQRTFSLWFNQQAAPAGNQNKLFGYGSGVAGKGFDVGLEGGGVRLRFFGGNIAYGTGFTFTPGGANQGWRHLAVRVNAGATIMSDVNMFLDGVQLTAGVSTNPTTVLDTTSSPLGIGTTSILASNSVTFGFTGYLDEFRIYDTALSNQDIAALAVVPEPSTAILGAVAVIAYGAATPGWRRRRGNWASEL